MMRLLKLYLKLGHLSMYKQWICNKKWWFFLKKTMKAYFKAVMLSLKIYENILKFNFLMGGIRHTDCLCNFFKAVIYRCKKRWRCRNFITTLKYFRIDTREWARCKTMKTCVYSLYYSSASSGFSKRCCQCTFSRIFKGRKLSWSHVGIWNIPSDVCYDNAKYY